MGFFTSEQKQTPGAPGYIGAVSDWAKNLNTGLDFGGRSAKKGLKALRRGEYDSDPALSGYFAPIRDMYATSVREGERASQMGVGAKWGADNPVLSQRVTQLNEERAREGEGQAMTRMIPELYDSMSNQFGQAKQRQLQSEGLQLSGLSEAMRAWLSSFYNKPSTFSQIAGPLSQAAGGAAAVAGMI